MEIDIVGEDYVTQAIIQRLVKDYRSDITINNTLPARGGQIKNLAPKYNKLNSPIFLLTDLDAFNCPPELIADWFGNIVISKNLLFRIAQDEAESWLMSDRSGFAKWIGVDISLIPERRIIDRRKNIYELPFNCKPSLYMMSEIASKSNKRVMRDNLTPLKGAKKGPAYNATLLPYIQSHWNIENAVKNSYSLAKAIMRLNEFQKIE